MTIYHSVTELIGRTPLIQLHKLDTGPCSLFLKLENQNPGGSIKDRVALSMINDAERTGQLRPGGTIIEATAGNTGLGLALAKRITDLHGGSISVRSAPGEGSCFSVRLPVQPASRRLCAKPGQS